MEGERNFAADGFLPVKSLETDRHTLDRGWQQTVKRSVHHRHNIHITRHVLAIQPLSSMGQTIHKFIVFVGSSEISNLKVTPTQTGVLPKHKLQWYRNTF